MQKILKQHNSIGVESVTDATKDEKGMYSLNPRFPIYITRIQESIASN